MTSCCLTLVTFTAAITVCSDPVTDDETLVLIKCPSGAGSDEGLGSGGETSPSDAEAEFPEPELFSDS